MISFKDFLTEARMAPLYHATSKMYALKIITELKIKPSDSDSTGRPSISFTRSFRYAQKWNDELNRGPQVSVILEFDQLALSHNYKLVPTNYFAGQVPSQLSKARYLYDDPVFGTNEYEERVYGREIKNVDRYLTAIHIFDPSVSRFLGDHFLIKYRGKFINQ